MADLKISQLPNATLPLAGTEVLPIVQSGVTDKVTVTQLFTNPVVTGNATVSDNSANTALKVTQTGTGNALVVEDSASTDSTPFVIDASGFVVAGHTAKLDSTVLGYALTETIGTDNQTAQSAIWRFSADTGGAGLSLYKSRSGTIGTNTVVQSNDVVGCVYFNAADGSGSQAYIRAAQIGAAVDGTPGTNDMPGRLVFSTTADGASSPTERMRIDSSGNVLVTSGTGGLGYGVGAGGTVTQATSKSTAVTLNKPCGQITMHNAALASGAFATFQLTNSVIALADSVFVDIKNPVSGLANYRIQAGDIGTGYCWISLQNVSAGSLSDAVVVSFKVFKGATS